MSNRPSETEIDQLIDCLRHRSVATTAAQMRMAAALLEPLRAIAVAARALVLSASGNALLSNEETVDEAALQALETALADAGYDMTDEELDRRIRAGMVRLDERGEVPR